VLNFFFAKIRPFIW